MEPEITIAHFLQEMREKNYLVFDSDTLPFNLNIVGWRRLATQKNKFDDYIGLYWKENGLWISELWSATTEPGTPWLLNPMNPKGTAILVPGQYVDAYRLGIYKDYLALKQIGPLRVYRDNNRDGQEDQDSDTIEEGLFGIHIHKAGIWSQLVGVSSAGCQVFQRSADFKDFIALCEQSEVHHGKRFTYTLLEF